MKNLFIPTLLQQQTNRNCNDRYKYLTLTIHSNASSTAVSVYSARKTNTRIISYRRREGSRKFTDDRTGEGKIARTTLYGFHAIYTRRIECIVRRKELKIGLPDREIAHGFGSLAIYEQRFSVFSAG